MTAAWHGLGILGFGVSRGWDRIKSIAASLTSNHNSGILNISSVGMAFFQSSITIHTIQLQVWYSAQKGEEKESEAGMKLAGGNVVSPPIQDNMTLACFVMMVHGT